MIRVPVDVLHYSGREWIGKESLLTFLTSIANATRAEPGADTDRDRITIEVVEHIIEKVEYEMNAVPPWRGV